MGPTSAGPFCHRSLLTLEEKHVPYTKTFIDFANKPQWLLDVNPAGSVPVMKVRGAKLPGCVDACRGWPHPLDCPAPLPLCACRSWPPGSGLWTAAQFRTTLKRSSQIHRWARQRTRRRCAFCCCLASQLRSYQTLSLASLALLCLLAARPLSAYAAPLLSWTPLSPSPQSSYSPAACSGLDVLGKFGAFIKSSPEEAAEKEADLVECLRGLDAHLTAHGPFIGGAAPCATDCAVMPRLYHMQVGTKYFRVGGFVGLGG